MTKSSESVVSSRGYPTYSRLLCVVRFMYSQILLYELSPISTLINAYWETFHNAAADWRDSVWRRVIENSFMVPFPSHSVRYVKCSRPHRQRDESVGFLRNVFRHCFVSRVSSFIDGFIYLVSFADLSCVLDIVASLSAP